jgi:hypothetical protein
LGDYIKLAVDVEQENIWGAGWFPGSSEVTFDSLINIRPRQGNRMLEVQNQELREKMDKIIREKFAL